MNGCNKQCESCRYRAACRLAMHNTDMMEDRGQDMFNRILMDTVLESFPAEEEREEAVDNATI